MNLPRFQKQDPLPPDWYYAYCGCRDGTHADCWSPHNPAPPGAVDHAQWVMREVMRCERADERQALFCAAVFRATPPMRALLVSFYTGAVIAKGARMERHERSRSALRSGLQSAGAG